MLLPLSCFYGSSHGYSKSKLLVKEQVSLKIKIRIGYACVFQFLLSQCYTLTNLQPTFLSLVKTTKTPTVMFYAHVVLRARTCAQNHFTCTKISAHKY